MNDGARDSAREGARGRTHGLLSSIRATIAGAFRGAPPAASAEDALWERREASFTPDGAGPEIVSRDQHWELDDADVVGAIAHADAAYERGFRPRDIDVIDTPGASETLAAGDD